MEDLPFSQGENQSTRPGQDLRGKSALITGGVSGVGLGISKHLAACGANVVMNYKEDEELAERATEEVNEVRHEDAGEARCLEGDVTSLQDVERMVATAVSFYEQLDIVVHNVGASHWDPVRELDVAEWDSVLAHNLYGAFFVTKSALQIMRQKEFGRIIYIGLAGSEQIRGAPNMSAEALSKNSLVGLAKSVALEEADKGITANVVNLSFLPPEDADPGEVENLSKAIPMGRVAEPDEVGRAVAFLAAPESSYITGNVINVSGGFNI